MNSFWTPEKLRDAEEILGDSTDLQQAVETFRSVWGVAISRWSLFRAFKDSGRFPPSTYVGKPAPSVELDIPIEFVSDEPTDELERMLIVPDVHRPYHSETSWQLMLKAARHFKPHRVVVMGDFADCYGVSSHSRNPTRRFSLDYELADVKKGLSELEALKAKYYHYIFGNHEYRVARYLMDKAPELFDSFKLEKVLELQERGWVYTPYKDYIRVGKLYLTHDEGTAGATANMKARETFEGNTVIGHTHRMAISYSGNAHGETKVGAMFGWLGDPDTIEYMPDVKKKRFWQHGFGVGYMEPNGVVHLQACPIINNKVLVGATLIVGDNASDKTETKEEKQVA